MLNPNPIKSTLKDRDVLKLQLGFHSLLVRAFPDRSIEILIWRTLVRLAQNSNVPKVRPLCAKISKLQHTKKRRASWPVDFKNQKIRFLAVSEFIRALIGADCGREEPMRILKETIFSGVDPFPIFLYLAQDYGGNNFSKQKPKKQIGRPRGSVNKKHAEVIPLFSENKINRAA